MVELFRVLLAKKHFLVGLVAQLFHPASNWVETVEKALVATAAVFADSINSCYICVISCAICTPRVILLVNKKDGICVVHPLIHFFTTSSTKTSEGKKRDNSTSRVSSRHVYLVDPRQEGYAVV